jgi:hypothetical protein
MSSSIATAFESYLSSLSFFSRQLTSDRRRKHEGLWAFTTTRLNIGQPKGPVGGVHWEEPLWFSAPLPVLIIDIREETATVLVWSGTREEGFKTRHGVPLSNLTTK